MTHLKRVARMLEIVGALNIGVGLTNSLNGLRGGFINLLCGCLLMYALGRIRGKIDDLRTEHSIHE